MAIDKQDVLNQEISAVFTNMIDLYVKDEIGQYKAYPSTDINVVEHKNYYTRSGSGTSADPYLYSIVPNPIAPYANNYYELYCINMNDSGNYIKYNNVWYMPCAFEVVTPDSTSINEESGTFSIAGVTGDYVKMIQEIGITDEFTMNVFVIKLTATNAGTKVVDDVQYGIAGATINSKTASLNLSFKSGSILNYYASRYKFSLESFPCMV